MIKKIFIFNPHLFALLVGILVVGWSFLPYPKTRLRLIYDHNGSPINQLEHCDLLTELLTKEFILEFPDKIRLFDRDFISLSLQPPLESHPANVYAEGNHNCSVGIDAEIKNMNLDLEPGPNISIPFTGQKDQIIQWQLYADKKNHSKPVIWIYVLFNQSKENLMQKWPLFNVPLDITVIDLWGISPLNIRYLSLATIGVILILIIRRRTKKKGML